MTPSHPPNVVISPLKLNISSSPTTSFPFSPQPPLSTLPRPETTDSLKMQLTLLPLLALAAPSLAQTFNSYGCYTDIPSKTLTGSRVNNFTDMTPSFCETFCTTAPNSYTLFGVEYGGECYCGDALSQGSFPTFATDCDATCPGDNTKVCGGGNRLSLYGSSTTPPVVTPNPYPPPAVSSYTAQGCYAEPVGGRALKEAMTGNNAMTVEACASFCLNGGWKVFGLEYERECWCGSAVNGTVVANTECNMSCTGNTAQECGGNNRLSVWQWE